MKQQALRTAYARRYWFGAWRIMWQNPNTDLDDSFRAAVNNGSRRIMLAGGVECPGCCAILDNVEQWSRHVCKGEVN
jgi:hypothetical protein